MKYICLLRGINVGGKNPVAMPKLRDCFTDAGYTNVSTYINSGNVIFESAERSIPKLIAAIEKAIAEQFQLKLRVTVVSAKQLAKNIAGAPKDWGNDTTRKHNLLFVRPPKTAEDVLKAIGETKPDLETVSTGQGVVYWSASLAAFGRTASSKFASKPIYQDVTVRNYNTSVKLLELTQ